MQQGWAMNYMDSDFGLRLGLDFGILARPSNNFSATWNKASLEDHYPNMCKSDEKKEGPGPVKLLGTRNFLKIRRFFFLYFRICFEAFTCPIMLWIRLCLMSHSTGKGLYGGYSTQSKSNWWNMWRKIKVMWPAKTANQNVLSLQKLCTAGFRKLTDGKKGKQCASFWKIWKLLFSLIWRWEVCFGGVTRTRKEYCCNK